MKQPLFPSTISTQLHFAYFLAVKAIVRKFGKSDGQTGSWCLDKAVLAQGGGRKQVNKALHTCTSWYAYAAMFGSSIDTMDMISIEGRNHHSNCNSSCVREDMLWTI